jgi:hypothetical protein
MQKNAEKMQKKCRKNAENMHKICRKYEYLCKYMHKICTNMQLRNMQEYAQICIELEYATNMRQICKDL